MGTENTTLTVPITVEFEDVDAYGIGHHVRLIAFLERARLRFLVERGFDLDDRAVQPVVYDVEMRFLKSVQLLDRLEVSVYVKSAEAFKVRLGYRIHREGVLIARAATTLAFVNAQTKELVPVPSPLLEAE